MSSTIDLSKVSRSIASDPRTRRWGKRFAVFMMVLGVLGFFVVPPLLKSVLLDKLGTALNRDVLIESISINPYTLTATATGVSVRERNMGEQGEVFGFDSLRVNAELTSIAVAGIVIKEIDLVGPRLKLVRLADNRYNISDLFDSSAEKPQEKSSLPRFSVSNIRISGGKLSFDDRPEAVSHSIDDIRLQIPFLSTLSYYADTHVEPHFSAVINGAPLVLSGTSRPFDDSLESDLTLDLDNLQLAKYFAYLPVELPIKVLSGAVDGDLRFRFVQTKKHPTTVSISGKLAVKELKLEESKGAPLLAFKRLDIGLREADLVKWQVGLESVVLDSPEASVHIDKQGVLNWLAVFSRPDGAAREKPEESGGGLQIVAETMAIQNGAILITDLSTGIEQKGTVGNANLTVKNFDSTGAKPFSIAADWTVDAGDRLQVKGSQLREGLIDLKQRKITIGELTSQGGRTKMTRERDGQLRWFRSPLLRLASAAQKDKETPWQLTLNHLNISESGFVLEDRSFSPAAVQTLDIDSLELNNFSMQPDNEAKLAAKLRINKKGELEADGTIKPALPEGALHLALRNVEMLPWQRYFSEFLNVTVTKGHLAGKGEVRIAPAKTGVSLGYKGNLTLANFHSVDKANSADFLKWKSFHFGNMDIRTEPLSVAIGDIALSDFYARVIVSPEGKLNLANIVRKDEDAADAKTVVQDQPAEGTPVAVVADVPEKEVLPIKIGTITLQGGSVNFSDNFVKPNYSASLSKLGGRVSGLSSVQGSTADLELRGSYEDVAPLNIRAKLNPLSSQRYLDLDAEVKGVELTSFSSYSGKYAGYAIERGKLSLFLKYKIENQQLSADNRVFLDQLSFGEPVASPDATQLPVNLAVALLQNRAGEIDINLPISGSLDDPDFSVGGIVFQAIANVFVKAVTSPFALLGSLFGGGEELAYVDFDYGYALLTEPMRERLKNLAKALADRPNLKIDLAGRIDPERDREGLKHALMERRVKAQRLEELVKQGTESGSLDSVVIPAKDYPRYLERAYKAADFPKPRNMVGLTKDLPVEEMEKLMMANMKVDEEGLRDLANRRAHNVSQWLANEGKIDPQRIFTLKPNLSAKDGPQNDKAKDSRVDFTLK
ncbi:MAG: DUF748 domain-containing protein [Zoogloeaceae bacterium]|nr:DUF748 domain-containing protein [Zoogloeaceae bacterium]